MTKKKKPITDRAKLRDANAEIEHLRGKLRQMTTLHANGCAGKGATASALMRMIQGINQCFRDCNDALRELGYPVDANGVVIYDRLGFRR